MGMLSGQANITVAGSGDLADRLMDRLQYMGYNVNRGRMTEFSGDSYPDLRTIKNSDMIVFCGNDRDFKKENFDIFISEMTLYPDKLFLFVNRDEGMTETRRMMQEWQLESLEELKHYTVIKSNIPSEITSFIEILLPQKYEMVIKTFTKN